MSREGYHAAQELRVSSAANHDRAGVSEAIGPDKKLNINAVIRAHLSGERLCVVMIAKDAAQLRDELLSERFTSMSYASERPAEVLAEDRVIGALELGLQPDDIRITPVDSVFA